MVLKITQRKVLKVLVENEDKSFSKAELIKLSGVTGNHVDNAVNFFIKHDYIYSPDKEGKISVTPDGVYAYEE